MRTGGGGWRCPFRRHGGKRFCPKHQLAEANRSAAGGAAAASRVSTPFANASSSKLKPTTKAAKAKAKKQEAPCRVSDPEPGQIWAFARGSDNFPRSYARIDRILVDGTSDQPLAEATPLMALPGSDDELILLERDHLLAAGTFRSSSESRITKPISEFLFQLSCEAPVRGEWNIFYKIFPKKGEIWAVYEDYDALTKKFKYKLVEIVSNFSEKDGMDVLALMKVDDGVYRRQAFEGFYMLRRFSRKDLSMFSHRVPVVLETTTDGGQKLWQVMLH